MSSIHVLAHDRVPITAKGGFFQVPLTEGAVVPKQLLRAYAAPDHPSSPCAA